jgi:hypothetical protein
MANNGDSRDAERRSRANPPPEPPPPPLSTKDADADWDELELSDSTWRGRLSARLRRIRNNPAAMRGITLGVLLLVVVVGLFGWRQGWLGCRSQPAAPVVAQPARPVQPLTRPQQPPRPAAPSPAKTEDAAAPKLPPPLPDDLAKWKTADYARARQENDPKLYSAITRLGEKDHGSAPAADELIALLKPLPATPPPSGPAVTNAPPRNPGEATHLVEAVIAALGENHSEPARKTLEQIVSGTLVTEDDRAAVEAALKALAAHPVQQNTAVLLQAIIAPEKLRPADRQGPWPAKDLRARAFELFKPIATGATRIALAEGLGDRVVRAAQGDPIRDFLMASDPLNCNAQIVLYQKAAANREVKAKLEQQLAEYGAQALGRLLDVVNEASPGGAAAAGGAGRSDHLAIELAKALWSEKFRSSVESQFGESRPLDKQSSLAVLACTIPQDSTRAALLKLLRKHAIEGPKSLETAGLPDRVLSDPGLLVLVKMLPRRDTKPVNRTSAGAARGKPGRQPATGAGKTNEAAQKKEAAEKDWMSFSSKLVAAWCKHLFAAATAKEKAAIEASSPAPNTTIKLPADFALGEGARVIAAYHVLWPDEAPPELAEQKLGLLDVYYFRIEETNRPKRAIGFYGRQAQARVSDARTIDRATWLDGARTDTQTDRRRSVDVLISRADAAAPDNAKDDKEADLMIELLIITIKNPTGRE